VKTEELSVLKVMQAIMKIACTAVSVMEQKIGRILLDFGL